ncbi:hypothetical protein [Bradyrhizobium symbiodeficiens]|uniref:Uncharacterized protein n=1 Tax=Bradyrhizobium symbiodeficiens TaxID=1404367 RepID=A0A6G9AC79_9BRAD|nr:hypothetical protein [Bradyrhizobium symbiodeficiens]QIP09936.1 hypothetical protein HAV00_28505 [Bradyrhizobium symbiodeficiens]
MLPTAALPECAGKSRPGYRALIRGWLRAPQGASGSYGAIRKAGDAVMTPCKIAQTPNGYIILANQALVIASRQIVNGALLEAVQHDLKLGQREVAPHL